jgi:hypothetical protein
MSSITFFLTGGLYCSTNTKVLFVIFSTKADTTGLSLVLFTTSQGNFSQDSVSTS